MKTSERPDISGRLIHKGDVSSDRDWQNSTPEECINAVWELTLLCLAWENNETGELRLQRSISRIQRPQR